MLTHAVLVVHSGAIVHRSRYDNHHDCEGLLNRRGQQDLEKEGNVPTVRLSAQ